MHNFGYVSGLGYENSASMRLYAPGSLVGVSMLIVFLHTLLVFLLRLS